MNNKTFVLMEVIGHYEDRHVRPISVSHNNLSLQKIQESKEVVLHANETANKLYREFEAQWEVANPYPHDVDVNESREAYKTWRTAKDAAMDKFQENNNISFEQVWGDYPHRYYIMEVNFV